MALVGPVQVVRGSDAVDSSSDGGVHGHGERRYQRHAQQDAQQQVERVGIAPAVEAAECPVKRSVVGQ